MFVLDIGLQTRRAHLARTVHGVIELHRVTVVGHRVTGRVTPFPFADGVAYQFRLSAQTPYKGVLTAFPGTVVGESDNTRFEIVTGMLVEDTRTQHIKCLIAEVGQLGMRVTGCRTVCRSIGEYVLTGDIEVLPLVGVESRQVKTDLYFLAYLAFCTQRCECRQEAVFLLPLVVDAQVLGVLTTEGFGERIGCETVIVLADVAQEGHVPFWGHFPRNIGLIVDIGRLVVTGRSETAEHVFGRLVTQSVHLTVSAIAVTDVQLRTEQTGTDRSLESSRTFVGDIQH